MRFTIDRQLPVSVAKQLQGQIEFGVTNGDVPAGSRLPSVRDLAAELGMSPVTVSGVYKALRQKGIICTIPGHGAFVASDAERDAHDQASDRVDAALRRLSRLAEAEGLDPRQLIERLQAMIAYESNVRALRVVFVGVYPHVTRSYVSSLSPLLRTGDALAPTTFDALHRDPESRMLVDEADVVLTFAHRKVDLEQLVKGRCEVLTVRLLPSKETRLSLASLDPNERVVLISGVPEFLTSFRRAVGRFAGHVDGVRTSLRDASDLPGALAWADVVILATDSSDLSPTLPTRVRSFEYRHAPDPVHFERVLLPRLERVRSTAASRQQAMEAP